MTRPAMNRGELGVTLAIVAVLGGLLAVGIVRAREMAARTSCQNNLKSLTLGVHCYVSRANKLPPLVDPKPAHRSVFGALIPDIEGGARGYNPSAYHTHSSVAFPYRTKDGEEHVQHGGDANQLWKLFIDPGDMPSEQLRDVPVTLPDGTTGFYATGSYAANGQLPWGRKVGDGEPHKWPAQAILFAERPQACRTATGDTVHNLWGVGFYSPQMPAFATRTPADPPGLQPTGHLLPADPECATLPLQVIRPGQPCDPRRPGALHRSGMNAAMGDGSVRLFAPDTDPAVFWAACASPE